jgi:SAM-dependent methyltransferase
VIGFVQRHKDTIKRLLSLVGYDHRLWARSVMYDRCFAMIRELKPAALDVLEISAGPAWRGLGFRSFTETQFPKFDICSERLDRQFDLIIADQIFEHLLYPYSAARNVHAMLRPAGHFLITTPFLIRVHREPQDCTRWTETGLRYFLAECGFPLEAIHTDSWGNRACVTANFRSWTRRGWFGSLRNEPDFPVAVWALAQKSAA